MSPCAVCDRPGQPLKGVRATFPGGALTWVEAPSPGAACSPECATFVFVRPSDETEDQRKLSAWRWRQRRAQARGEAFNEAPPMDEAERGMLVRDTARRGLELRRGAA
jgi:hypothetical protein